MADVPNEKGVQPFSLSTVSKACTKAHIKLNADTLHGLYAHIKKQIEDYKWNLPGASLSLKSFGEKVDYIMRQAFDTVDRENRVNEIVSTWIFTALYKTSIVPLNVESIAFFESVISYAFEKQRASKSHNNDYLTVVPKSWSMAIVYDVVVIGAGLMGSAAAYFAAKRGKRVLLLEQFEVRHGKGSSHGSSRIFRVAYPSDVYTKLSLTSLEMWRDIEKEAGVELIRMTGEIDFASKRIDEIRVLEETLERFKVPYQVLTGAQVNERFPGFSLPSNSYAVFNSMAGVLNPTLALETMQNLAKGLGAEIREHSPVKGVTSEQQTQDEALAIVTLTDGTEIRGSQCIVTAGAWTTKVLKQSMTDKVTLQPIATFGTYWKCKQELYTPDKFPVFIKYGYPEIYGLPMMHAHEGVKICRHDGPSVNPDKREGVVQSATDLLQLQAFVAENFAHVDSSSPNKVDHCMYTMTPDANFIIDFLAIPVSADPASATKKIVVGAGFSGHGAKMTPVIGQMLVDLAFTGKTKHSIESFRLTRSIGV